MISSAKPSIAIAATIMQQGGVIAYPTEAVWGLGCDPFDEHAVRRLQYLKMRDLGKGLILIASNIQQVEPFLTDISAEQRQQLNAAWPGPFTWLVPNNGKVPSWICGRFSSIALRVTQHPDVRALCDRFGGAIVSTSANPQGKPAPHNSWQVHRYFHQHALLDYIVKGQTGQRRQPSTITDLVTGKVIR